MIHLKDLIESIKVSDSIAECLRNLNLPCNQGHYYRLFHSMVSTYNLDTSHFTRTKCRARPKVYSNEEIFKTESLYSDRASIKRLLIREGYLKYKCYGKGCMLASTWLGGPLSLHLDHINGIRNDNRLENLRLLCPNCHSQTSTYAGKRNKYRDLHCKQCRCSISYKSKGLCRKCANKIKRAKRTIKMKVSKDELLTLLKTDMSMVKIGHKLNMSDNGVRKWCKKWGLKPNHPNRGDTC